MERERVGRGKGKDGEGEVGRRWWPAAVLPKAGSPASSSWWGVGGGEWYGGKVDVG